MRWVQMAVIAVNLAGCYGGMSMYRCEGVAVAQQDRERQFCEATALAAAPEQVEVEGRIQHRPEWNAELRRRVMRQCMRDRGYTLVDIPPCPDELAANVQPRQTVVMPRLTESTCIIQYGRSGYQIITPR